MSNVFSIGQAVDQTENQAAMVSLLEAIIAEIKSGRTIAYAIASVTADQSAVTRWQANGQVVTTLGAVARLQWELAKGTD